MNRIGIDVGLTGAIAMLCCDTPSVHDMPVAPRRTGKGNEVNGAVLDKILTDMLFSHSQLHAYVERVSARSGQGVTGVFSFGRSLGVVEGVLSSLGIPYQMVSPQVWKRRAGLIGRPKDESRTVAMQLYPDISDQLKRKKDVGRADALLIARFGEG